MKFPPALVIASIEIIGDRVAAELQIGPRQRRIVIDLSMLDVIIGSVQTPTELDGSIRPHRAVLDVMIHAFRGEHIGLPLDLSSTAYETKARWPGFELPVAGEPVPPPAIKIMKVTHNLPERGLETVRMNVLGVPTLVIVDNCGRNQMERFPTLFRFVEGIHPWQLTDTQSLTMALAIDKVVKGGIRF